MRTRLLSLFILLTTSLYAQPTVPQWAKDAVWYQIFPERFRNGNTKNDPTREELELPADRAWKISPWTSDWYKLHPWEGAHRSGFYENVFDRRYGGDLQGVIEKLDYLKDLGVTALYFNPVFEAFSLHKYDASTYHHIDNNFGPDRDGDRHAIEHETDDPGTWTWTAADKMFLKLIREAHARGIRVIIDGVFNHCGTRFWAFEDVVRHQQASRYSSWFDVRQWDMPSTPVKEFEYKGWWDYKSLPEFAETDSGFVPAVRIYFSNITKRWMDPNGDGNPSDGIDGWRLDVANDVSPVFWKAWRKQVKGLNPEAYIVGEIWDDASKWLSGDQFDAVMNYRFARACVKYFIDGTSKPTDVDKELADIRKDYAPETNFILQNLLDSHDTDRLASMIANPGRRYDDRNGPRSNAAYYTRKPSADTWRIQRLMAFFQMTYLGAPMIYYGVEAGMWGADDPDDRKPMVWQDLKYEPEATGPEGQIWSPSDTVLFDASMHRYYRSLIRMRNTLAPLRRGDIGTLLTDNERNHYGFIRTLGDSSVVVLINNSGMSSTISPSLSGRFRNALTGEVVGRDDAPLSITLDAQSGVALVPLH
ncbi:MAG: hypothetical protein A2X67_13905 [Ignavibacteria bacterium GWA2_55_11]|nr:MAG: hypothetical protein A2X67_13905 [Ignavibacteria bacterium GWA2_55_11]OGU73003.1 MAG: hypothetical protein A3H45_13050 [Ignavibacteria bacterium RIFCSPLOWO2_02_FULL_55_14]